MDHYHYISSQDCAQRRSRNIDNDTIPSPRLLREAGTLNIDNTLTIPSPHVDNVTFKLQLYLLTLLSWISCFLYFFMDWQYPHWQCNLLPIFSPPNLQSSPSSGIILQFDYWIKYILCAFTNAVVINMFLIYIVFIHRSC